MNHEPIDFEEHDEFLQCLSAELTDAAYQVALRHGVGEGWYKLELDMWRVLTDTLESRFKRSRSFSKMLVSNHNG